MCMYLGLPGICYVRAIRMVSRDEYTTIDPLGTNEAQWIFVLQHR